MNIGNSDFNNLKFASLFHDIGKFFQRTNIHHNSKYDIFSQNDFGQNGAHSKWSADFINKKFGDNGTGIEKLVFYHHKYHNHPNSNLCAMLKKADEHSSKERIPAEKNNSVIQSPLVSIFSEVNLDDNLNKNYFIELKKLSLEDAPNPIGNYSCSQIAYNLLWNEFNNEFDCITNLNDFTTMLYLLKKYTSSIPSAAFLSVPDISLYDHSKTTCALAISRYIYSIEGNDKLKKTVDTQNVYLVITGNISGIQNFIYKVSSSEEAQKGMSKRLRGRSLYLSLIIDAIANNLIVDLNLTQANILFCGGGKFTIIAANTKNTKDKLNELSYFINNEFIKRFNAEIYFTLEYVECCGNDFKDFSYIINSLNEKINETKKHKFYNNLNELFNIEDEIDYTHLCSVCGNLTDNIICKECESHENLGKNVANSDYLIKCFSNNNLNEFDVYFKLLNIGYLFLSSDSVVEVVNDIVGKCSKIEISRINDTNFLEFSNQIQFDNVSFSFTFIANSVPKKDNEIMSFDEMSSDSIGSNKLGILKMDVDDLGLIFSKGLTNRSLSRISTLSSYLDMFFSGLINKIANEYNIYINYSGGDDLLVIGSYDNIIKFSLKFREEFKKWTCYNPSLNISGGISIVNPKFPISKAVQLSNDNLSKSKKYGKNKITIFDEILKWDTNDFIKGSEDITIYGLNDLMGFTKYLENCVNNNYLSKGILYSFLYLWQSRCDVKFNNIYNIDDDQYWLNYMRACIQCKRYIPLFKYKLRLINNKKTQKYVDEGMKYMPWIKFPVSWISLRTR